MLFLSLIVAANADIISKCQLLKKNSQYCREDSHCVSGYCNNNSCSALPKLGAACGPQFQCADGLGCVGDICKPKADVGETCQMSQFGPFLCKEGLLCYDGICGKVKNESKAVCSDFVFGCSPGTGCSFQADGTSICVPLRGEGKECTSRECASGLFCNLSTLKCSKLRLLNSRCSGLDCEMGLDCLPNKGPLKFVKPVTCQQIPTLNQVCTVKCASGLYCAE